MSLTRLRRFAAVFAVAVSLSGCEALGPDRAVILPIVRLEVPPSVEPSGTLVAKVTVQSGGCRRFNRLVAARETGQLTIRALGLDSSGPNVLCPGDIREDVVDFRAEGPFTDPFVVIGTQPQGEDIRRTVRVLTP